MERSAALRRALAPLGPYLSDVVLIGGWVPWLYLEEHAVRTSLTIEADVLLPQRLPRAGRPELANLLSAAGFDSGAGGALWRGRVEAGEQIEFLMPNLGMARDEGTIRQVAEQPRLGAVSLESLWPLGEWIRARSVPGAPPLEVRVSGHRRLQCAQGLHLHQATQGTGASSSCEGPAVPDRPGRSR